MRPDFSAINAYFDKIYILTLPRLTDRIASFTRELEGLNYEIFYGVDKEAVDFTDLKERGVYDSGAYKDVYKKRAEMSMGMLCCSLGHVRIYESIIFNNYKRVLILEDDAFPILENLARFAAISEALPVDWEVFYLGYERNETYGWKQQLKRTLYKLFPFHSALRLSRQHYANYYPKNISPLIAQAGFHDCTHAYAVTQAGARKLLQRQTPVAYNPDNLLAFAIAERQVKGYICRPKLFNQRTAFVHEMASLTA
ncbi:glycosyltransferase family 25 protein [Paraflavitalea pollutisoli]|uniref:glycosyltransferase family 25 protein n=1 Tax=Paraflavitalea pollutisoli TaxID=3034143 RepID=UPI0023EC7069|nr:glycosyltransferase family 25 protein [Paraflavitalea sp. H1-2-19X]